VTETVTEAETGSHSDRDSDSEICNMRLSFSVCSLALFCLS